MFANWRNVGRAMLDARRREGVTAPLTALDNERRRVVILDWRRDGINVRVAWRRGEQMPIDIGVNFPERDDETAPFAGMDSIDDAGQALRVLAALDLIPAHLAYAADERYGKCQRCGRLAQWVPQAGPFAARWCHLDPTRPYHKPEVAP
jgi:hypothetical protein